MLIEDIRTIMWKAQRGLFRIQGRRGQTILMIFTPLFLAVLLPLEMREDFLNTGFSLMIAFIVPLLLVGTSVPAAFASEREQHTLASLLASRLSDRAILFGKIITAVAFGWIVTLLVLMISLVTTNIVAWDGRILFYEPEIFLADLAISFFFSVLIASAGVLFSLKAESVQQAQQTLMALFLVPAMILQAGFFVVMTMPDAKNSVRNWLESITVGQAALVIGIILAILAAGCLWLAVRKFNRARLVLE